MSTSVVLTGEALEDLHRLYDFLLDRDLAAAEAALERIERAFDYLRDTPFGGRKAAPDNPFLRELIIGFGRTGFVALYEVESADRVVILAVRAQREGEYG